MTLLNAETNECGRHLRHASVCETENEDDTMGEIYVFVDDSQSVDSALTLPSFAGGLLPPPPPRRGPRNSAGSSAGSGCGGSSSSIARHSSHHQPTIAPPPPPPPPPRRRGRSSAAWNIVKVGVPPPPPRSPIPAQSPPWNAVAANMPPRLSPRRILNPEGPIPPEESTPPHGDRGAAMRPFHPTRATHLSPSIPFCQECQDVPQTEAASDSFAEEPRAHLLFSSSLLSQSLAINAERTTEKRPKGGQRMKLDEDAGDADDIDAIVRSFGDNHHCDRSGRCSRHPQHRLRRKKLLGGWKVLMKACPECCVEELRKVRSSRPDEEDYKGVPKDVPEIFKGVAKSADRTSFPLVPPRGTDASFTTRVTCSTTTGDSGHADYAPVSRRENCRVGSRRHIPPQVSQRRDPRG